MGTPVGLLNYGSKGSYFRVLGNEIFSTNLEYTTGNCLNCSWVMNSEMPFDDRNQIYNQNAMILGYDHFLQTWGFGYGFQKVLYNKFSVMPSILNKKRVMTYGVKFIHLNRTLAFDNTFNLVTKLNFEYGKRMSGMYIFSGISLNYFLYQDGEEETYAIRSLVLDSGNFSGLKSRCWPGYAMGIQF